MIFSDENSSKNKEFLKSESLYDHLQDNSQKCNLTYYNKKSPYFKRDSKILLKVEISITKALQG